MTVPGNLSSPLLAVAAAAAAAGPNITKSVRLNSADSAHLNRTPSSAGSNTTWTLSTWVKKTGNDNHIFGAGAGNTPGRFGFGFNGSDKIFALVVASGSTVFQITTDAVFRDPSAWYHLVLIADTGNSTQADRFKIYVNGVLQSVSGTLMPSSQNTFVNTTAAHVIGRRSYNTSDPFNGYLADFYLIDGTALEPTSFGAFDDNGVWQAKDASGLTFGTNGFHLFDFENITGSSFGESWLGNDTSGNGNNFTANNIIPYGGTGSYTSGIAYGNRTLTTYDKDDVVDGDLTNGYIDRPINNNGLSFSSIPEASTSVRIHCAVESGTMSTNAGTLTTATGSDVGVWKTVDTTYPFTLTSITVTGGSSSDGFYIYGIEVDGVVLVDTTSQSAAEGDLVYDVPVNSDTSDTGVGGELSSNYATFNPLSDGLGCTVSNGNLQLSGSATSSARINGTIGVSSGKWYFEVVYTATDNYTLAGVGQDDITNQYPGQDAKSYAFDFHQGKKYNNGSQVSHGSSLSAGDIFMCALDLDNNKIFFGKNGTFFGSGNPATGANPSYTITAGTYHIVGRLNPSGFSSGNAIIDLNAGQRAYSYSAPTGFKSWNTSNLPTPTIADGSDYFNAITYAGDGVSGRTITTTLTTVGLAWIKRRNGADNHRLSSVLMGDNRFLGPNLNSAEQTSSGQIQSFSNNTFDIGNDTAVNSSSNSYIAWAWDAGTSNASNTDGSITSTVRANIAAGFSVVTYTGNGTYNSSIGHGLGVSPHLLIVKARSTTGDWAVYTRGTGAQKYLLLNSTAAEATDSSYWAYNTPETSVFRVGANANVNANGTTYVAHCFAPVAGYSAVGKFTSTNTTDNAFVYTGFAPRWILWTVSSTSGGGWFIYDAARKSFNPNDTYLAANTSAAEGTASPGVVDLLSNGFKVRNTLGGANDLIYLAFASNPFQANGGLAR